jgi:hypothetical protein
MGDETHTPQLDKIQTRICQELLHFPHDTDSCKVLRHHSFMMNYSRSFTFHLSNTENIYIKKNIKSILAPSSTRRGKNNKK